MRTRQRTGTVAQLPDVLRQITEPQTHRAHDPVRGVHPPVQPVQPYGDTADHRCEVAEHGPDVGERRFDVGEAVVEGLQGRPAFRLPWHTDAAPLLDVEEIRTYRPRDFAVAEEHGDVEDGSAGVEGEVGSALWITLL
ncbi:hypothetical protein ADK46_21285 [Streptomyces rimosus subsp. rimosus]|nr:hypothetical protein ADK46_21285 [Streptomyces rimosus subsp. rimosus]